MLKQKYIKPAGKEGNTKGMQTQVNLTIIYSSSLSEYTLTLITFSIQPPDLNSEIFSNKRN